MKKYLVLVALTLGLFCFSVHAFGYPCTPYTVPADPAPAVKSAGTDCLAKIEGEFNKGEKSSKQVSLKERQSVWVAANGCPRAGNISIDITDVDGKVLKVKKGTAPSFCFVAPKTGTYTLTVELLTTTHGTWGTVDSCLSASKCGVKKAQKAKKALKKVEMK